MHFSLQCVVSLAILPSCLPLWQVKEKEHRMRARAQKLEDQRLQQELRLRRMQERAQGGPKIRVSSAASVGMGTQGNLHLSNFSLSLSLCLSFSLLSLSLPPPLLPLFTDGSQVGLQVRASGAEEKAKREQSSEGEGGGGDAVLLLLAISTLTVHPPHTLLLEHVHN